MKPLPANAAVALVAVFLSGCVIIPFPFHTPRTPDVSGRVVDASTRLPVAHASVQFLHGDTLLPSPKTITDETGQFHLRRTRNWHLGAILGVTASSACEISRSAERLRRQAPEFRAALRSIRSEIRKMKT